MKINPLTVSQFNRLVNDNLENDHLILYSFLGKLIIQLGNKLRMGKEMIEWLCSDFHPIYNDGYVYLTKSPDPRKLYDHSLSINPVIEDLINEQCL